MLTRDKICTFCVYGIVHFDLILGELYLRKNEAVLRVGQEAQLMLTTGTMRLAVSRGQQTWYRFGSVATFR